MSRQPASVKVSVVVPTHNRATILRESLSSVLAQSHQDIEVIVVDDASTDETREVVHHLSDSRIIYKLLPTKGHSAVARNVGIEIATGSYVAFLDSDDQWHPDKVRCQLESILQSRSPTNIVSYTQVVIRSRLDDRWIPPSSSEPIRPATGKRPEQTVADYLFCAEGLMQTSTLMLHRALARRALL